MKKEKLLKIVKTYNQFETKHFERDNKKFSRICIKEDIPKDINSTLVELVYRDTTADDYVYTWIAIAFDDIESMLDSVDTDIDSLHDLDFLDYIDQEIDVCTYDLTQWLGSNVNRVYYLTEALEEYGITDGFQALSMAQGQEIKELFYRVIDFIEEVYQNEN